MRSLLLLALVALATAVAVCADSPVTARLPTDSDDAALLQLGIDLQSGAEQQYAEPKPSYTSIKPVDHEPGLIAKFPLLHEIKGLEAKDWSDIQGLLFREPPSAMESNVDMKLDELEQKFNKIDTMPIPSSIPPKGSSLLKKKVVPKLSLKMTLQKPGRKMRLQQLKAKTQATAKQEPAKPAPVAATKPKKKLSRKAEARKAAKKAKKLAKKAKKAAKKALKAAKKAAKKARKAKKRSKKVSHKRVRATIATVKLIEKRIQGLATLFQRLKGQMGLNPKSKLNSAQRLTKALAKHRKDKADLKKRLAERNMRFAQVGMDSEGEAEGEADAEAEAETETETEAEAETETETEAETEAEAETETESEDNSLAETDAAAEEAGEADVDTETEVEAEGESEVEGEVEGEAEGEVESEAEAEQELMKDAAAVDDLLKAEGF